MDSEFIGAAALSQVGAGDAHSGDRAIFLRIEETVTVSSYERIEAVLYAYMNNERVAALDFVRSEQGLCINMVFVKLEFRRRGIGSALVQHLTTQYPNMKTTCISRLVGSDPSGPFA